MQNNDALLIFLNIKECTAVTQGLSMINMKQSHYDHSVPGPRLIKFLTSHAVKCSDVGQYTVVTKRFKLYTFPVTTLSDWRCPRFPSSDEQNIKQLLFFEFQSSATFKTWTRRGTTPNKIFLNIMSLLCHRTHLQPTRYNSQNAKIIYFH